MQGLPIDEATDASASMDGAAEPLPDMMDCANQERLELQKWELFSKKWEMQAVPHTPHSFAVAQPCALTNAAQACALAGGGSAPLAVASSGGWRVSLCPVGRRPTYTRRIKSATATHRRLSRCADG